MSQSFKWSLRRPLLLHLFFQRYIVSNSEIKSRSLSISLLSPGIVSLKMKPPIRLAVLECDTPLPNTKAKYARYGGVFEALIKAGAEELGQPDSATGFQISKWQIELHPETYPDLKDIDAILITGASTATS